MNDIIICASTKLIVLFPFRLSIGSKQIPHMGDPSNTKKCADSSKTIEKISALERLSLL